MKFGGTSVSSKANIENIAQILIQTKESYIVVVSALSGTTDRLHRIADLALDNQHEQVIEILEKHHNELVDSLFTGGILEEVKNHIKLHLDQLKDICHSIYVIQERSDKIMARIQSFGELMSSYIIHAYLNENDHNITLLDSRKYIKSAGNYLRAEVNMNDSKALIQNLDPQKNYIAGGFVSSNKDGETMLLGRGGSDYSAAIYAAAIEASKLEIWSDVNGMQNANPKVVSEAGPISVMSYKEAFEMAFFGAKVLYPPSIQPVMLANIPLYLKNTFAPNDQGTYISDAKATNNAKIIGVSSLPAISIINITGVGLAKEKGTARRVFQALEESDVNIILITQSCSEQSICLGIHAKDGTNSVNALNIAFKKELERGLINPIEITNDNCIIAVVGDNMKDKIGLSGRMFSALGKNGINISAIAQGASERNISIVINKKDEAKAINVIHQRFFQKAIRKVHLFIAGVGNVGQQFLEVIYKQKQALRDQHHLELNIIGVANSSKYLLKEQGLTQQEANSLTELGVAYTDLSDYVQKMKEYNLNNSIFVDNTASQTVSDQYAAVLDGSISVVACNKIACSSSTAVYNQLQDLAREKNCSFRYETAVGAALPIIKTIQDIIISGDEIKKIQAVLSGSLNFIFNNYDTSRPFADVVMDAKIEGYTEPNPLIDLSGVDVMRKILILARESGYTREMSDVTFNGFLPESCAQATNNDMLFAEMRKHENHFAAIYQKAMNAGNRLKVVAEMDNGNLSVELREVGPESPFYHLSGKDNIVSMHTSRYINEPIIIKGAGAGAEITASGVFSDIMQIVNR